MKAEQTWIALGRLKFLPRGKNPRRRHKLAALRATMADNGFGQPITVNDTTGHTVAGEGRVRALRAMKTAGQPPPGGIRTEKKTWLIPAYVGQWPADREPALALALNGGPDHALEGELDRDTVAAILAAEQDQDRLAALALTDDQAEQYQADTLEEVLPPALDLEAEGIETLEDVREDTGPTLVFLRLHLPEPLALRFRRVVTAETPAEAIITAGLDALETPQRGPKKKPAADDAHQGPPPAKSRTASKPAKKRSARPGNRKGRQ